MQNGFGMNMIFLPSSGVRFSKAVCGLLSVEWCETRDSCDGVGETFSELYLVRMSFKIIYLITHKS